MPPYEIRCYKIWWENNPEMYVGATRQPISGRMSGHRRDAKMGKKMGKIQEGIRKCGYDFNYILLESCMVNSSDEKRMREQEWIDKLKPSLNMNRAFNNEEQKIVLNNACSKAYRSRPEIKAKREVLRKIYDARPEIKARKKLYNARPENKAYRKVYKKTYQSRPENKAKKATYNKAYYHANKDVNREKRNRKARQRYHAEKLKKLMSQETEQEVAVAKEQIEQPV